jgi:hypothetical protein
MRLKEVSEFAAGLGIHPGQHDKADEEAVFTEQARRRTQAQRNVNVPAAGSELIAHGGVMALGADEKDLAIRH